jgi:hypothetical protein
MSNSKMGYAQEGPAPKRPKSKSKDFLASEEEGYDLRSSAEARAQVVTHIQSAGEYAESVAAAIIPIHDRQDVVRRTSLFGSPGPSKTVGWPMSWNLERATALAYKFMLEDVRYPLYVAQPADVRTAILECQAFQSVVIRADGSPFKGCLAGAVPRKCSVASFEGGAPSAEWRTANVDVQCGWHHVAECTVMWGTTTSVEESLASIYEFIEWMKDPYAVYDDVYAATFYPNSLRLELACEPSRSHPRSMFAKWREASGCANQWRLRKSQWVREPVQRTGARLTSGRQKDTKERQNI